MAAVRERRSWWASLLGLLLAAEAAEAQGPAPVVEAPPPPAGPVVIAPPAPGGPVAVAPPAPVGPVAPPRRMGPIKRAFHHAGRKLHEDVIGDPDLFAEPPLGANMYEAFGIMRARAAPHIFTLYRSDFLVGTSTLTPEGAGRMARIAGNVRGWCGPVVIEPTPDRPGLAESRRDAILAALGPAVGPERVVVGPPVAPGGLGTDAANFYQNMIIRDQQAAATYTLTPTASSAPGGAGGPR